ncbi:MAG TPA: 3-hydroxyacyl-CoA dehydrogenase family protein [Thermoanaerobaculia bacterium]|nr:3-hydroxyacyl-CoA dehydrogenase family protein [Thermoanaerobaculia bacterium]
MKDISTVAVLGAGTMGRGIAQVAAQSGLGVRLFDVAPEVLAAGHAAALAGIARFEAKGTLAPEAAAASRVRLAIVPELADAVRGADLVLEAVPESLELKRELFARVEPELAEDAVLASNTSSIPIALLADRLARPGRFLGLHFFNPVPLMKLLEIVAGPRTEPEVVEAARALAARLGKEPVVVQDAPGFATSRLGVAIGLEAIRMLEAGVASAADIDRAMELGYGHPMGPLRLTDLVGLDVRLAIARTLERELGPRFAPPRLLVAKVEAGELGKKTGRGFYEWEGGAAKKG